MSGLQSTLSSALGRETELRFSPRPWPPAPRPTSQNETWSFHTEPRRLRRFPQKTDAPHCNFHFGKLPQKTVRSGRAAPGCTGVRCQNSPGGEALPLKNKYFEAHREIKCEILINKQTLLLCDGTIHVHQYTHTTMTSATETATTHGKDTSMDPNEAYKVTQSRILSLQETILDSSKNMKIDHNTTQESTIQVDSSNILNYTKNKYKNVPKIVKWLKYDTNQCHEDTLSTLQCAKNELELILQDPPPFLPNLNPDMINKIVSVYIPHEIISQYLAQPTSSNKRWTNNEIWGSDVYTDDSDIVLVLKHLGVFEGKQKVLKEDGVAGKWDPNHHPDIIVNLLILDTLQAYQGFKRYGIRSRDWVGPQLHDGLSYAVHSIEFKPRDFEYINTSSWV